MRKLLIGKQQGQRFIFYMLAEGSEYVFGSTDLALKNGTDCGFVR